MATYSFRLKDLQPIFAHVATHAPGVAYDDLFDPKLWKRGAKPMPVFPGMPPQVEPDSIDVQRLPKRLMLVKDSGIYLMALSEPPLLLAGGDGRAQQVVYSREVPEGVHVAGDDYGIPLETRFIEAAQAENPLAKWLRIGVSDTRVTFAVA